MRVRTPATQPSPAAAGDDHGRQPTAAARRRPGRPAHPYAVFAATAVAAGVVATLGVLLARTEHLAPSDLIGPAVSGTALVVALGVLLWELVAAPLRLQRAVAEATSALQQSQEALVESRERFLGAFDHAAIAMALTDLGGRFLQVNRAMSDLFEQPEPRLLASDLLAQTHPDDRDAAAEAVGRLVDGRLPRWCFTARYLRADGSVVWGETNVAVSRSRGGRPSFLVVQVQDVTEHRRAEEVLTSQSDLLERIAKGSPLAETLGDAARLVEAQLPGATVAVHLVSRDGSQLDLAAGLDVLPAARAALACCPIGPAAGPLGEVVHHGQAVVVSDVGADPLWADSRDLAGALGAASAWMVPIRGSDDRDVLGLLSIFWSRPTLPGDSERQLAALCTHLAAIAVERSSSDADLEHQAMHDVLTSLPNRALFLDRVSNALSRAERRPSTVAVLLLDIDRFQVINDSMGHAAGDRILTTVATRLAHALRPGDTVSRFGGDEFIALCEDVYTVADAERIAARLEEAVRKPIQVEGGEVVLTASVGIAVADSTGAEGTVRERTLALLRDADAATHEAKHKGRARHVVFDASMRTRAVERLEREKQLRRALQRGELWVAYQPVVDLRTGRISGVEALARWDHPDLGPVSPAEFIPLAEETGLIHAIGDLVLHEALTQVGHWRRTRPECRNLVASINLSAHQLASPDLADVVQRALQATGVDPAAVCLEITESILVDDTEHFLVGLQRLKDLGVVLGVDDFGTGYSSLTYLKRFPVDVLKIDHSFVAGLGDQHDDTAIVEAIIDLAHALGLTVVAEGVETASQLRALLDLGCDRAQGFLFSRPEPPAAVEARFGRRLLSGAAVRVVPSPADVA